MLLNSKLYFKIYCFNGNYLTAEKRFVCSFYQDSLKGLMIEIVFLFGISDIED